MTSAKTDNTSPRPKLRTDRTAHLLFWPIAIFAIVLDLWSKTAVFDWLKDKPFNEHTFIEGIFKFVMRENAGAAFSMASGQRVFLVSVSIIAFFVVVGIFLSGKVRSRLVQFSLGMFTGGIVGNLYDRLFNDGLVRDFIDIIYWPGKHWPAFNVADSMLCISVGLLIIASFISAPDQEHPRQQK